MTNETQTTSNYTYPQEWTLLTKVFPRYNDSNELKLNKDLANGFVELKNKGRSTYLKATSA